MWSGKLLGGLVGGMVGGPVGLAAGAALGHYLADGSGASIQILRLDWQHHAFRTSGPGLLLTPHWLARGKKGQDVEVRLEAGDDRQRATVTLEADEETCSLPTCFVAWARFDGKVRVRIGQDLADFVVPLPSEVRRLGLSGPARLIMAFVACARAGGRELVRDDVRFIRETFTAAYPLDADGLVWFKAWARALRDADVERLAAPRVAKRLERHVKGEEGEQLLLWLMRGTRVAWPGGAQERFVAQLAQALGAADLASLWRELDETPDADARARAWRLFGLTPGASEDDVRRAWRTLAQQHHPDRSGGHHTRMAEINAAYRLLRES